MSNTEKEQLLDDLSQASSDAQRLAIKNFYFAFAAITVCIVGTGFSAVVIAAGWQPWVVAICSSLPSAAALMLQVCKWDARSKWWWMKFHKLRSFSNALKYEGAKVGPVSEELSRYNIEMERSYPVFGAVALRGFPGEDQVSTRSSATAVGDGPGREQVPKQTGL